MTLKDQWTISLSFYQRNLPETHFLQLLVLKFLISVEKIVWGKEFLLDLFMNPLLHFINGTDNIKN